ncbi:allatostatin A-like [Temnothorax curvispinosus]|uniref:Allatostatin A-like n=1 Tax=Temnothorax curvispinosus TaxID=300111 RepID=A0A6J1PQJ7_9HYME|nr:allatostatin A-like [Temnothorax curvispinosus]
MKPRTSLITTRIIMFYLLSVVGSTTAIEDASSSSLRMSRFRPLLNNLEYEQPEKKAYIAEYKRLPVYNFGIGKRWADNNEDKRTREFSFGVGKRLRDYRFGLGKRSIGYHPLSLDYFPTDNMEGYQSREDNSNDFIEDKRGQHYDFGVGKRSVWKLATGETAGRRLNDVTVPKYLFGLGNALDENEDLIQ